MKEELIESSSGGVVRPSSAAVSFAEKAAAAICSHLTSGKRSFRLMPYRHGPGEYLGFDWRDEADKAIAFTFTIGVDRIELPTEITPGADNDLWVCDATDALLLVRLIAEKVKGESVGKI